MAAPQPGKLVSVQNPKMLAGTWIFAVLWCGISFPLFYGFAIAKRDFVGGSVGGLFALIGLVILYGAIKATLEYIKFGKVHLVLARRPETGGQLEARLELPVDMHRGEVSAELACVQVVWSRGSKGGSSRRESDDWTHKQSFPIRRAASGCEAVINLDVPADRPASSLPQEGPPAAVFEVMVPGRGVEMDQSYYRWEVRIKADVPGIDLERIFRLRIAAGAAATYRQPVPLTAPALDLALERRLDERRAAHRRLVAACALVGFLPIVTPFVIMGLAIGLAGCPMGWSGSDPPHCVLAGIDWGPVMTGAFDLMSVAVPAGIAGSTVLFLAGQAWLKRAADRPSR